MPNFGSSRKALIIPIIILAIVIFLVNLPDLLNLTFFTLTDKTNIILTSVIAMFAVIQGYSAYTQVNMEKRRNEIKSVSDELEKAYGPIDAILSRPLNREKNIIELLVNDKYIIDEKFTIYRCLFSPEIIEYWEKNIQKLESYMSNDLSAGVRDLMRGNFSVVSGSVDVFRIPSEFAELFNSEYMKIVKKQRELLKP